MGEGGRVAGRVVDLDEANVRPVEGRAQGEATVPSTIGDERSFNPFLRCREPTVARFCGLGAASGDASAVINVIRKLRNAKDSFAGSSRPWVPGGGPLPGL